MVLKIQISLTVCVVRSCRSMRNGVPNRFARTFVPRFFSWVCLLEIVDFVLAVYLFTLLVKLGGGSFHLTFFFSGQFPFSFLKTRPNCLLIRWTQKSPEFVDLANQPISDFSTQLSMNQLWPIFGSYVFMLNWFWEWYTWFILAWIGPRRNFQKNHCCDCDRSAKNWNHGFQPWKLGQNLSETTLCNDDGMDHWYYRFVWSLAMFDVCNITVLHEKLLWFQTMVAVCWCSQEIIVWNSSTIPDSQ